MSLPAASALRRDLVRRVAWGSIALGILVQAAVLLTAATVDAWPGGVGAAVATLSFVSWSVVVCTGLAAAYAASDAKPGPMALAGLALAPVALLVARGVQAGLAQALDADVGTGGPSPLLVGAARAVEYALLGAVLALLARRPGAGAVHHVVAGLVLGLATGATLALAAGEGVPEAVPRVVNEALFPAGCALLLFLARGGAR